jgi:hypothetical protein
VKKVKQQRLKFDREPRNDHILRNDVPTSTVRKHFQQIIDNRSTITCGTDFSA